MTIKEMQDKIDTLQYMLSIRDKQLARASEQLEKLTQPKFKVGQPIRYWSSQGHINALDCELGVGRGKYYYGVVEDSHFSNGSWGYGIRLTGDFEGMKSLVHEWLVTADGA